MFSVFDSLLPCRRFEATRLRFRPRSADISLTCTCRINLHLRLPSQSLARTSLQALAHLVIGVVDRGDTLELDSSAVPEVPLDEGVPQLEHCGVQRPGGGRAPVVDRVGQEVTLGDLGGLTLIDDW